MSLKSPSEERPIAQLLNILNPEAKTLDPRGRANCEMPKRSWYLP